MRPLRLPCSPAPSPSGRLLPFCCLGCVTALRMPLALLVAGMQWMTRACCGRPLMPAGPADLRCPPCGCLPADGSAHVCCPWYRRYWGYTTYDNVCYMAEPGE